jgi:hypothetical protein
MNWTTLSSTLLGGLLALGGTTLGQWWNERRALRREERDREHEREVWARQIRYEAHLSFVKILDDKHSVAVDAENDPNDPEAPEDWLMPVWDKLQEMRLVSEEGTISKADEAFKCLQEYVYGHGKSQDVSLARDEYLGAVRKEFRLPPIAMIGD